MSLAIKPLRTWLHILSISPLFMTFGFVAMHFGNSKQVFIFWGIFLSMIISFPYVLKQILALDSPEAIEAKRVEYVEKDPGRFIPMYILPFFLFANSKTEDIPVVIFVILLLSYVMFGPLAFQASPVFWFLRWRIYRIDYGQIVIFYMTKKRIMDISGHIVHGVRLSPAFFVDTELFVRS